MVLVVCGGGNWSVVAVPPSQDACLVFSVVGQHHHHWGRVGDEEDEEIW